MQETDEEQVNLTPAEVAEVAKQENEKEIEKDAEENNQLSLIRRLVDAKKSFLKKLIAKKKKAKFGFKKVLLFKIPKIIF
jgi:hypothetical protein